MTFPMKFLKWLTRNWEADAEFTFDELLDLYVQWVDEGKG